MYQGYTLCQALCGCWGHIGGKATELSACGVVQSGEKRALEKCVNAVTYMEGPSQLMMLGTECTPTPRIGGRGRSCGQSQRMVLNVEAESHDRRAGRGGFLRGPSPWLAAGCLLGTST